MSLAGQLTSSGEGDFVEEEVEGGSWSGLAVGEVVGWAGEGRGAMEVVVLKGKKNQYWRFRWRVKWGGVSYLKVFLLFESPTPSPAPIPAASVSTMPSIRSQNSHGVSPKIRPDRLL